MEPSSPTAGDDSTGAEALAAPAVRHALRLRGKKAPPGYAHAATGSLTPGPATALKPLRPTSPRKSAQREAFKPAATGGGRRSASSASAVSAAARAVACARRCSALSAQLARGCSAKLRPHARHVACTRRRTRCLQPVLRGTSPCARMRRSTPTSRTRTDTPTRCSRRPTVRRRRAAPAPAQQAAWTTSPETSAWRERRERRSGGAPQGAPPRASSARARHCDGTHRHNSGNEAREGLGHRQRSAAFLLTPAAACCAQAASR